MNHSSELDGVVCCEDALSWDRRRLACTEREARKTSEADETPAVAGKSLRKLTAIQVLLLLVLLCLMASFAVAQVRRQRPVTDDPAVEERLRNLSHELRCLVCQNETLAESRADLAEDLRDEIRVQIKAGKSDKEIIAFLTDRYGQFILYRPQVTPTTYLLWFGPFVLLLGGLAILFFYIKQRRDMIAEQPLSTDDRRRAEDLLRSSSGKETV